jgi:dihydroorotase
MNKKEESVKIRENPWPKPLLIRGGRVIDPSQKLDAVGDVLLREGRVAEVAPPGAIKDVSDVFDARGLVVAPGFIDLHVHLREPGQTYKESIHTGTEAAAAGGFTSVCCMPNTSPVNDTPEVTTFMLEPERGAVVNVFPVAAATVGSQGERLTDYAALRRAGAVGVSDDGHAVLDDHLMQDALRAAARIPFAIFQHAEDPRLSAGGVMHDGPTAFRLGLRGIPGRSESDVVQRDIELARAVRGSRLHVSHVSTQASIEAIARGKKAGAGVSCEVTPHHFTLTDEDVGDYDTRCKVNPPLRSAADREALLRALEDGTVDAIATDHAPHALHEKQVEFDRAPFGLVGLETALALAITRLRLARKVSLTRIIELLSTGPARVAGLEKRGVLARGAHADITIFDPKKQWMFEAAKSRSKSRNTPFDGWKLTGKVVGTIVGGAWAYRAD